MSMNEMVSLKIDPKTIEGIVNAHVETAVAAALDKEGKLVKDLVHGICTSMVDSEGRPSRDSYSAKFNLIEWSLRTQMRNAVEGAVKKWLSQNEAELTAEVEKVVMKSKSAIAKAFVGFITGVDEEGKKNLGRLNVNFTVDGQRSY